MHRGFYGVVLAAAVLAGCSTVPVPEGAARAVPAERVYKADYLSASADRSAQIYVTRDKGYSGSGCSHDISLNNEKILSIRQSEAATLHVAPGSYFLKLETGGGLCPNISTSQNLTVAAGDRQVYRILLPSDGNLRLTREK
ncbi:DUF2846 domain-containing protein [Stenotrophomonas maltophilia]|uniref:DUF2846 domain-containing protein n=1 Tax=Stenotrophomonas maltophilia TaxID=40324 RepID=UPI001D107CF5|nr:DUF2846 domain-containing protein [Stenotrophomonas maltophilia]UXB37701.1 DUF2846 domain-containing protein [Stenotrophomonas maltophilia]